MFSWVRNFQRTFKSKREVMTRAEEWMNTDPQLNMPLPPNSEQVAILSYIPGPILDQKNWYVKRKKANAPVRGGISTLRWIGWDQKNFCYLFGIRTSNPNEFLYITADSTSTKVVLSPPGPAPSNNISGSDARLFQKMYSRQSESSKLFHVASQKYATLGKNNRIILSNDKEHANPIDLDFYQ